MSHVVTPLSYITIYTCCNIFFVQYWAWKRFCFWCTYKARWKGCSSPFFTFLFWLLDYYGLWNNPPNEGRKFLYSGGISFFFFFILSETCIKVFPASPETSSFRGVIYSLFFEWNNVFRKRLWDCRECFKNTLECFGNVITWSQGVVWT